MTRMCNRIVIMNCEDIMFYYLHLFEVLYLAIKIVKLLNEFSKISLLL